MSYICKKNLWDMDGMNVKQDQSVYDRGYSYLNIL